MPARFIQLSVSVRTHLEPPQAERSQNADYEQDKKDTTSDDPGHRFAGGIGRPGNVILQGDAGQPVQLRFAVL